MMRKAEETKGMKLFKSLKNNSIQNNTSSIYTIIFLYLQKNYFNGALST